MAWILNRFLRIPGFTSWLCSFCWTFVDLEPCNSPLNATKNGRQHTQKWQYYLPYRSASYITTDGKNTLTWSRKPMDFSGCYLWDTQLLRMISNAFQSKSIVLIEIPGRLGLNQGHHVLLNIAVPVPNLEGWKHASDRHWKRSLPALAEETVPRSRLQRYRSTKRASWLLQNQQGRKQHSDLSRLNNIISQIQSKALWKSVAKI